MKDFWREVRNKNSISSSTSIIDGHSEQNEIINLFSDKFIPSSNFICSEENLISKINHKISNNYSNRMNIKISIETLKDNIHKLKPGKGHDNIPSCLLKEASDDFLDNLVVFMNLCFKHSYLPYQLLRGIINPVIKDNKKSNTTSSNYRPIMISSSILKLIELHAL